MKILLLHVQGLQVNYIGCYGNDWVLTPNLDRLAVDGIVFDQHFAAYPKQKEPHGLLTGMFFAPGLEGASLSHASLFDLLQTAGVFGQRAEATDEQTLIEHLDPYLDDFAAAERGVLMLDCPTLGPPWFIDEGMLDVYFGDEVNDNEEHIPWLDPPAWLATDDDSGTARLQDTFGARVTDFDDQLGEILDLVDEAGDWATILVGSCGLAVGEHGYVGEQRPWLHEEIVHVPLLMRLPESAGLSGDIRGLRVSALTQSTDLLPTLLELLAIPAPPMHGKSLVPLLRNDTESIRPYACSALQIGHEIEWCLRTPEWSFLLPIESSSDNARTAQLYAKPDDRFEVSEVCQQNVELADGLEQTLRDFMDKATKSAGQFEPPPLPELEDSRDAEEVEESKS